MWGILPVCGVEITRSNLYTALTNSSTQSVGGVDDPDSIDARLLYRIHREAHGSDEEEARSNLTVTLGLTGADSWRLVMDGSALPQSI
ncbi:hypothetical protein BH10CYA1_BH10CYA1_22610 [soil metagenome]